VPAKRKSPPPFAADRKPRPYRPRYGLALECRNEAEQRRLYRRLRQQGLEPKVLVL